MTSNIRQFTLAVDQFVDVTVPEQVQAAQAKIGLQGLRGLVLKTPVDTGRARGNWQASSGAPATGEITRTDKAGGSVISAEQASILTAEPYSVIYLTNNVPYILKLEDGSSQQAPQGMVAVTLAELEAQFARIE